MRSLKNTKYLNTICENVKDVLECTDLFNDMKRILHQTKSPQGESGVGLAANQIGDNRRCIFISTEYITEEMINPVIVKKSGMVRSQEGCLSFPGQQTFIQRSKQITVTWLDINGEEQKQKFRGLESRVIQHEIDHLNGISLFKDAFE